MKEILVNSNVVDKKHGAVRLVIDSETNGYCLDKPTIAFDGTIYKMWYITSNNCKRRINYVTSEDGKTWINHNVITLIGDDDSISIQHPYVIFDNDVYKMWYVGRDNNKRHKIHYATSTDGVVWVKRGVVMSVGDIDVRDNIMVKTPFVILDKDKYKVWYGGYSDNLEWKLYYAEVLKLTLHK